MGVPSRAVWLWLGLSVFGIASGHGDAALEHPGVSAGSVTLAGRVIDAAGVHVGPLVFALAAIGRGDAVHRLAAAPPVLSDAEVTFARAEGVTEWWRSVAAGLEQGVTLASRPAGHGALTLEMSVGEDVQLAMRGDDTIGISRNDGALLATYAGLSVVDADGRRVPATLAVAGDRIAIHADDRDARYPLIVDPIVAAQEAELAATPSFANRFGYAVAISSDGSRAIVGASDGNASGIHYAAYVFVRSGTTWTQEQELQVATDGGFGRSVAISADGSRALVGGYGRGDGFGLAYVFSRSGSTWTQEASIGSSVMGDQFGVAVALSDDGATAIVGANRDATYRGAANVFTRSGSTWTRGPRLVASDGAANAYFGGSVAVAGDGTRVIVGAVGDAARGANSGAAYVYSRATGWAQEAKLSASDAAASAYFGTVALSQDGSRALVGADGVAGTGGSGAAYVFLRSGTGWSQEARIVPTGPMSGDQVGASVSLSADGTLALIGSGQGTSRNGRAHVFSRAGTAWSQAALLTASDGAMGDQFGGFQGAALSGNGARAIIGANQHDGMSADSGSAYVFTIASSTGSACSIAARCGTGNCVDGFCCDTACGGGATDCMACSGALTGGANGTCAPLSATAAASVVCRPSIGPCDPVSEHCTSTSTTCPADSVATMGTECRAAVGLCDQAEVCNGTSNMCPADGLRAGGMPCRASTGPCDIADSCTGTSATCPDTRLAAGAPCLSGTGPCDPDDTCDGVSGACPAIYAPSTTMCRPALSVCDVAETCTGSSGTCPVDGYAPATTGCGPPVTGVCDAADHCAGTSADCVDTFAIGVLCRASAGACDAAESCTGADVNCPPDAVSPAGTVCRASSAGCDVAESCDGVAASCPLDVSDCGDSGVPADVGPRDASVADGATPTDATTGGTDAATVAPAAVGCGCRASRRDGGGMSWIGIGLTMLWAARRAIGARQRRDHRQST